MKIEREAASGKLDELFENSVADHVRKSRKLGKDYELPAAIFFWATTRIE